MEMTNPAVPRVAPLNEEACTGKMGTYTYKEAQNKKMTTENQINEGEILSRFIGFRLHLVRWMCYWHIAAVSRANFEQVVSSQQGVLEGLWLIVQHRFGVEGY